MQARVSSALEEWRDSSTVVGVVPVKGASQAKAFPLRVLLLIGLVVVLCVALSILSLSTAKRFGGAESVVTGVKSGFQPCFDEPESLDRWIRPPGDVLHQMSDQELLWRASFVPRIKKYPYKRVGKVAFMFLTKGPMPLAPLWERFFKGHEGLYSIYVHSLPSFQPAFRPSSVFYKRHIPSQITEWGKMSMIDAERRLLANALLDISNERFILLSESCIPLYNFSVVYNYTMKSKTSFVGAFDDPGQYGRGRYNHNMAPQVNITQWRKGAQWFEVNRKLAVTLVEDTIYYPLFKEYCRPSCYVDEHYFPTMVTIESAHLVANRSLTWVDWSRGGAHPAFFGAADITADFFKRIYNDRHCTYNNQPSPICFLFARKFAPSTLEPLLHIAHQVFGF